MSDPLVVSAATLAAEIHGQQPYGRGLHVDHLRRVVERLERHSFLEPPLLAGGHLHDGYEDTNLDRTRLLTILGEKDGEEVHQLVWACTGEGPRRRDRVASILEKLRHDRRALPIKVSDRLDNVEQSRIHQDPRLFMYHREYPDFRHLRDDALEPKLIPMWEVLDRMMDWGEPRQRTMSSKKAP